MRFPIAWATCLALIPVAASWACSGSSSQSSQSLTTNPWTKEARNPVYSNNWVDPDKSMIGDPAVLYRGGQFYLWYASLVHFYLPEVVPYGPCDLANITNGNCALPMELATSTDGVTWTRLDRGTTDPTDDYVLERDSVESWDSAAVENPTVIFDEARGIFRMWYAASSVAPTYEEIQSGYQLGYAESRDGINWTKFDDPATTEPKYARSDPVLRPRSDNWDNTMLADPTVMLDGSTLRMWYVGWNVAAGGVTVSIGYAQSDDDGRTWQRRDAPVVVDEAGIAGAPEVVKTAAGFEMYYYASDAGIHQAVSTDGVSWTRTGIAIPAGQPGAWDELEVSSPAITTVGNQLFLYYTGSRCPFEEDKRKYAPCDAHVKLGLARRSR